MNEKLNSLWQHIETAEKAPLLAKASLAQRAVREAAELLGEMVREIEELKKREVEK